jgi:hypothetical protein
MPESSLGRWQAVAQMAPKQQRPGPDKDLSSEHKSLESKQPAVESGNLLDGCKV